MSQEQTSQERKNTGGKKENTGEKYFKVKFHSRSNPNDNENVELSVNGETRVIERDVPVVLPERFLECARNATHPQFRQEPGKQRKMVGKVTTFPFDVLGESSESEYRKMLAEGTKKTKEYVEKHGLEETD